MHFVSTRQMGPSNVPRVANNALSFSMLRGYRRSGAGGGQPDVLDDLDKALEWCQSECEKAAHQFLRDGECSTEIEGIKRKLLEVKTGAEAEIERLQKLDEMEPRPVPPSRDSGKSRQMKNVTMRIGPAKFLEVDENLNMEVDDDEGIDDMEPPTLIFKRSRDAT